MSDAMNIFWDNGYVKTPLQLLPEPAVQPKQWRSSAIEEFSVLL